MKHRPVNTKLLTEKGFRGAENNKKIIIIIMNRKKLWKY